MLDAVGNVQLIVHLSQVRDQELHFFVVVLAAEVHVVGDHAVTLFRRRVFCVIGDDLGQIHRVRRAVNDMRAVILERRARLVRHGVHDAQKGVRERLPRKALRVVHFGTRFHIAVVRGNKFFLDHLDGVNGKRIGIIAVRRRNVRLNRVRDRVHARVRHQFLRHSFGEVGIDDRHVGRDLEIRDGVFDTVLIVGDNGERRDFGRRARGRGDRAEMRLRSQLGQPEHLAHVLKRRIRIFIFDPHGFRRVDGRASAHGNDPIGLEFLHRRRALHHGFHRRIGFDALEHFHFHARFLQIADRFIEEAEAFHRPAADADHGAFSLQRFERF